MAEVNLLPTGHVSTSGLPKPEQASALREQPLNPESKEVLQTQNLPAGKEVVASQKAVSQVGSSDMQSVQGQEALGTMMQELNTQLEKLNNYLRFEKDDDTGKMVIMIKNSQTDEIIRQIPSDEFLTVSKNISEYLEARKQFSEDGFPSGLFTNEQV